MDRELPAELLVTADGPVRTVTLHRPDDLNAANEAMHAALASVWGRLAADPEARVVILTGAGRAFSAGGDFQWMTRIQSELAYRERIVDEARRILGEMLRFPLPIVAAVNGPAVGLGCSLALSCDLVLISDAAHLADPHVAVGLVAGDGGAALWPFMTSLLRAKEYVFTGERIGPELAVQLGLANRVVPRAELLAEAQKLAHRLAALPARALQETKRALNAHLAQAITGPMEIALVAELQSMGSEEHKARIRELLAGRAARK
jgi:enoyl-CoA hydratase